MQLVTCVLNFCFNLYAAGVSSLKHLLVKPVLRVTVWVVAAVTCVGNGMVLWGRFSSRDENKLHSLVIRNLAGKLRATWDKELHDLVIRNLTFKL
jgi:hypothetical protein